MKTENFDLIIVYSEKVAKSAMDVYYIEGGPFPGKSKDWINNDTYKYFLEKCKEKKIKAAFTTSKDIINPGLFKSYWTYKDKWIKNRKRAYSRFLFNKFVPQNKEQREKFKCLTSPEIRLFNNKELVKLFQNKLYTYNNFKSVTIPTVNIKEISHKGTERAKKRLNKHRKKEDLTKEYIIKQKRGYGGFRIFKINKKEDFKKIKKQAERDTKRGIKIKYILQPFIKCNKGFVFGKHKGIIDLRLVMLNNKIVQTYIRIAKKGDFKCNEHQGGTLIYIDKKDIPKKVLNVASKIIKKIQFKHSLYSLDFIKSNKGNIYLVEGNSMPGLDWNHKNKINEIKSKELIELVVSELSKLIKVIS